MGESGDNIQSFKKKQWSGTTELAADFWVTRQHPFCFWTSHLNGLIAVIKLSIKPAEIHVPKGPLLHPSTKTYTQRERLTTAVFSSALIPLKRSFCVNRTVSGTLWFYHPSLLPPSIWPILPSLLPLWVFLSLTTFLYILLFVTLNNECSAALSTHLNGDTFMHFSICHPLTTLFIYVLIFQELQISTVASELWWTCVLTIYAAIIPNTNTVLLLHQMPSINEVLLLLFAVFSLLKAPEIGPCPH